MELHLEHLIDWDLIQEQQNEEGVQIDSLFLSPQWNSLLDYFKSKTIYEAQKS